MCGITGVITNHSQVSATQELKTLLRKLKHRGPDSQGQVIHSPVTMGMQRLAIVDVSGGDQPFYSEDGNLVVIGNGEIYNYPELVNKVKKHHLRSKSDIEIILHLYEDHGAAVWPMLKGMFAVALYDIKRKKLILARDRGGEKPLYYTQVDQTIYFASELKALASLKKVSKSWSPAALTSYLHYYYIPEPVTGLQHVHKLPAASYAEINTDTLALTITPYWQVSSEISHRPHFAEELRETLQTACNRTMMADVPVGIALSGGLDSSAILALLRPGNRESLTAFTVGYEGTPACDERPLTRRLCQDYGIKLIETELRDQDVVDSFIDLTIAADDPVADIAATSLAAVNREARQNGVKVLLGGSGGDELFWGYAWVRQQLQATFQHFERYPSSTHVLLSENQRNFQGYAHYLQHLLAPEFKATLSTELLSQYTLYDEPKTKPLVAQHFMKLIRTTWLQPDILTLGDRLSMASSVELRNPFLDADLTELVWTTSQSVMSFDKPHKYWLKKVIGDQIPDYILHKPKQGFTPPIPRWLMKILFRHLHLLSDGFLVTEGIVSPTMATLVRGGWLSIPWSWYALYQLLVLEIWGRATIYGQTAAEIRASKA